MITYNLKNSILLIFITSIAGEYWTIEFLREEVDSSASELSAHNTNK